MQEIIEQIETRELTATEYRVARRLLHQADETGHVELTTAECIKLCQVQVWGSAARLLSHLKGKALIRWWSRDGSVSIRFLSFSPTGNLLKDRFLSEEPAGTEPRTELPKQSAHIDVLLSELIRQNGAIIALLTELICQNGGGAEARQNSTNLRASPHTSESANSRQNGDGQRTSLHTSGSADSRQNGENRRADVHNSAQNGAFSHTRTDISACARGLSVCSLDLELKTDLLTLKTDIQTDQLTSDLAREAAPVQVVQAAPPILPVAPPPPCPLGAGVEPELAMGLLTSREVALPLKDARAVAAAHPFLRIRDCVFFYRNNRVAKEFRSPRIMLTWLARWDEFMILPTDAHDEQTDLYQRFLLPAERQAKAEEAARISEMAAALEAEEAAWTARRGPIGRWRMPIGRADAADGERTQWAGTTLGALPAEDFGEPSALGAQAVLASEAPADEFAAHWQTVLADLALQMPSASYNTWVRDTWVHRVEQDAAGYEKWIMGVPNAYALDWLNTRLRNKIERALKSLMGHAVSVCFEVCPRSRGAGS